MADQRKSARQKLVYAAFQLFSTQGVGSTTTRQVADLAGVNEVTLFRQFGSKHGLLAAVMTEAEVLSGSAQGFASLFDRSALGQTPSEQGLKDFLTQCLALLGQRAELVRSVIGEAGQFSADNSRALGLGLQTIRDFMAEYLEALLGLGDNPGLRAEAVAGLVMALLLGYTAIASATESNSEDEHNSDHPRLWPSQTAFVDSLAGWLLGLRFRRATTELGTALSSVSAAAANTETWIDLPAPVVHQIMQIARKADHQTYALVYVLFGAGVAATEVPLLTRTSAIYDSSQHILLVGPHHRQVPLNQWIMGRRYGTYTKNPLTRWLKARNDDSSAMFLGTDDQPMTPYRVRQVWAEVTQGLSSPTGDALGVEQARATWCIEMLLKGLNRQALSLLSGLSVDQIEPLVQKAQARSALALALRLDQQPGPTASLTVNPEEAAENLA
jgi:AcrR family transcriptional regulator